MYIGFTDERIAEIGSYLDFEYDAAVCQKAGGRPLERQPNVTVSDVNNEKYLQIHYDQYGQPKYDSENTEGVIDYVNPRYRYDDDEDDEFKYVDLDADKDTDMHGLITGSDGHVVLYPSYMPDLYRFSITNGMQGTITAYEAIGRNPGQDILQPVPNTNVNGFNSAGVITRQLADMQMLFPGVTDYYTANHDFGPSWFNHGMSWPHAHPAFFKHLSRKAQETVLRYDTELDYDENDRKADRPPEALAVANALEGLGNRLRLTADGLSVAELRMRDGRYDQSSDNELAESLFRDILGVCNNKQKHAAKSLMAVSDEAPESERNRVGHWVSFQLASGVVATRQALHEVEPHPEADESTTKRTLNVYHILQKEMQRRLLDNKDAILE